MSDGAILLVEDNADDVELTLLALVANHVTNEVVVARHGDEALDYLFPGAGGQARATLPVLVLLDLNLPRASGLEVLRRMRADRRAALVPVVVLTSSAEEEDLVQSYRLGANSYIRKPVDFAAFHEATRQLSLYWLVLNRPAPTEPGPQRP